MPLAKSLVLVSSLLIGGLTAERLPSATRIKVDVSLVGDDGLTQSLQARLERNIRASNELELSSGDTHAFRITTDTNVVSDSLGGRRVLVYRVMLLRRDEMVADKMGVCFQRDVDKCAQDIVGAFRWVILDYASRGELP